jgi:large subunit ribosomal protein L4
MKATVYKNDAKVGGSVELPENIFNLPWNADLVHLVTVAMQANARQVTAHAKDRGEVSGGGKKPWRQKGTGRARHGSTRSPIWVGGGAAHGPKKEKNYSQKINKKARTLALFTVLSKKMRDGEIVFVEDFSFAKNKTKEAAISLKKLSTVSGLSKLAYKKGNRALVAAPAGNATLLRVFGNIPSVRIAETRNLNPLDVLSYQYIIFTNPKESVSLLSSRAK